jgi:hypothetical protein
VQLSAAQQLYASSFANRGPTIATLPPPTFEASGRHGHEQPSFYKNQVSSYVQHPTPRARSPDSPLSSTSPSTNTRFISLPTHARSIGPQSPPYSGNSVSDRSLRTAPTARDFTLRPNSSSSSSYARGPAELNRSLIRTEMPSFNRTSTYTVPQQTRNLFPLAYVDTVEPRELRNVTTAVKPPPSFEAPQSITSNVVEGPPHSSGKGLELSSYLNMLAYIPIPQRLWARSKPADGLTLCQLSSRLLPLLPLLPMPRNNPNSNLLRRLTRQVTCSQT